MNCEVYGDNGDKMNLNEQRDVFNIFHDGTIVAISSQKNSFTLKIEIEYLAELISPNYNHFFVDLVSCQEIMFFDWDDKKTITDISEISKLEPEILNCDDDVFDKISINCALSIGSGGELWIKAEDLKIFDQERNELTLTELGQYCDNYWDNFGSR
jgi:hypothetical protein